MMAAMVGLSAIKDRKKRCCSLLFPWRTFFWFSLLLVFSVSGCTFFFPLFFRDGFRPKLVSTLHTLPMEAVSVSVDASPATPAISIQETVIFPDQVLIFLKYPPSTPLFTKDDISCIYLSSPNSSRHDHQAELSPESVEDEYFDRQIVRCPLEPRGLVVSVSLKANGNLPAGPTYRWDSLAYEAMIDRDNTTIVFVKGFNRRSGRASDPSKFKCVYGWDFTRPKLTLQSDVVSIAQEIVRCRTPLSILNGLHRHRNETGNISSVKVSVRLVGRRKPLKSIARPELRLEPGPKVRKQHEMCICTMLRNQARFLREWVIYHARIGVERWFIYDNNSADDVEDVVQSLLDANYNVTRRVWPWIKTQEAGFAHCALRARDSCEWVGFIDVDEFFHLQSGLLLQDVLGNRSRSKNIAELRAACHNFGPSGLRKVPVEGVTVGYTCRMRYPERHKSIVRPEALNDTLINMVHHFHLKAGFIPANLERRMLVINHYKYQVWEVFKEKFYMRVATYVSDWKQKRNVRSKDRTPGLGTRAVEPPDWSGRFCQVKDTGLRDRVIKTFTDPRTGLLPWQEAQLNQRNQFQLQLEE